MTVVSRPAYRTARVGVGSTIRARHQNDTASALVAIQALQNKLITANVRPWAEQMLHKIKVIQGDYLECVRVWRGGTEGAETVYVARPRTLRQSVTLRDGVSYVYADSQTRTASKSGEADETQRVTPSYLVDDIIEAVFARSLTAVPLVDEQRRALVDANVDGRAWAAEPPP